MTCADTIQRIVTWNLLFLGIRDYIWIAVGRSVIVILLQLPSCFATSFKRAKWSQKQPKQSHVKTACGYIKRWINMKQRSETRMYLSRLAESSGNAADSMWRSELWVTTPKTKTNQLKPEQTGKKTHTEVIHKWKSDFNIDLVIPNFSNIFNNLVQWKPAHSRTTK